MNDVSSPGSPFHPELVEVMRGLGIDLSERRPERLTRELRDDIASRARQLLAELNGSGSLGAAR